MTNVNNPQPKKPDVIDWANQDTGGFRPLPPDGEHTQKVLAVDFGPDAAKGNPLRNKNGYLQAIVTSEIVAPGTPYDKARVSFTRINTQKWTNRNSNGIADFLASCGSKATPSDDASYQAAAKACVGQTFKAKTAWEAYDKETGTNVKGMGSFPLNVSVAGVKPSPNLPEGAPLPYVMVKRQDGSSEKVYANTRLTFFSSKKAL